MSSSRAAAARAPSIGRKCHMANPGASLSLRGDVPVLSVSQSVTHPIIPHTHTISNSLTIDATTATGTSTIPKLAMVEVLTCPFDQDVIPMVEASIVTIDDELSHDSIVAQPVLQPVSPNASRAQQFPSNDLAGNLHEPREWTQVQSPAPEETPQPPSQSQEAYQRQRKLGAGAAGALFGLVFAGPVGAIILGCVAMSYTKEEGAAGDVARGLGEIALIARDKAREVNDKHHIVEKGKDAAAESIERFKDRQRNEEFKAKSKQFFRQCYLHFADFARRHKLVERGAEQLKIVVKQLADHLSRALEDQSAPSSGDTTQNQRRSSSSPASQ